MRFEKAFRYAGPYSSKISRTAGMDEPAHDLIDNLVGVLLAFLSQVKVLHGRLETGMTEITLDDADIDPGLQQMGGVAMAKRMNGHARPCYSSRFPGPDKGTLDA